MNDQHCVKIASRLGAGLVDQSHGMEREKVPKIVIFTRLLEWSFISSSIMISFQALEPEGILFQVQICSVISRVRERNRGCGGWLDVVFRKTIRLF